MGGRVFKDEDGNPLAVRMNGEEYQKTKEFIIKEITNECSQKFRYPSDYFIMSPEEFRDKETFGDVDIICSNVDEIPIKDIISKTNINPLQIKQNGPITHILTSDYRQVDLIEAPWKHHLFYLFYLSCNVGQLFGIIARHLGLQLKMEGFHIRSSNTHIPVCYSNDLHDGMGRLWSIFEKVFKLDYYMLNVFKNNPTKENLFKLIWSSEFASHELFNDSLASCKHRKREADNPTYREFFNTIKDYPTKQNTHYIPTTQMEQITYWRETFDSLISPNKFEDVLLQHFGTLYIRENMSKIKKEHFDYDKFIEYSGLPKDDIESKKRYGQFRSKYKVNNLNQKEIKELIKY